MEIKINREQRLYVIPCGKGYSCLGFDVCHDRSEAYAAWLLFKGIGDLPPKTRRGTRTAYDRYTALVDLIRNHNLRTGERCPAELTPQLIGLEGRRVEVVDCYGETRRFQVGKSTGFIPCHLEIARRTSRGGGAVTGAPFKSVRVIR